MPTWLLAALPTMIQTVGEAPSIAHMLSAAAAEVQSSDSPVEKFASVISDIGGLMPVIAAAASANAPAPAAAPAQPAG